MPVPQPLEITQDCEEVAATTTAVLPAADRITGILPIWRSGPCSPEPGRIYYPTRAWCEPMWNFKKDEAQLLVWHLPIDSSAPPDCPLLPLAVRTHYLVVPIGPATVACTSSKRPNIPSRQGLCHAVVAVVVVVVAAGGGGDDQDD